MLLRPKDASRMLALSERTLWSMSQAGLLPCVRVGKSVRYAPDDLAEWVKRAKASPLPGPAELEGRRKEMGESA
jgi:excisionase family DNA binding protein